MDGFTGYAKAATQHLAQAKQVMDPFHVVHRAIDKLTACRQRGQNETMGHRGRSGAPLYGIRRILLTRKSLVTPTNAVKLDDKLTNDAHLPVQVTWHFYEEIITAYQQDRPRGREAAGIQGDRGAAREDPQRPAGNCGCWARRSGDDELTSSPTSTPVRPTGRWRTSTASWSTCGVSRWGSSNKANDILRPLIYSGGLRGAINALRNRKSL